MGPIVNFQVPEGVIVKKREAYDPQKKGIRWKVRHAARILRSHNPYFQGRDFEAEYRLESQKGKTVEYVRESALLECYEICY